MQPWCGFRLLVSASVIVPCCWRLAASHRTRRVLLHAHSVMQRQCACKVTHWATTMLLFLQIHFLLLMSRQGKVRLAKWYDTYSQKERLKVAKEITPLILARPLKLCNFLDWKNLKLVYKRYASLYFVCGVDISDNELIVLEIIHEYVEVLDRCGWMVHEQQPATSCWVCGMVCDWHLALPGLSLSCPHAGPSAAVRGCFPSPCCSVTLTKRPATHDVTDEHGCCTLHAPVLHGVPRYFGNVCELDLIFNFHKAYYILDELLIAGKCRMCLWSFEAGLQQCISTSWLRTHPFALSHNHLLAHCPTHTHLVASLSCALWDNR